MTGPNFSKAQTYPNVYVDNTLYPAPGAGPSPITFPWVFAPDGVPPSQGQFENLNANANPASVRLYVLTDGSQPATIQPLTISLGMSGGTPLALVFPVAAFTGSTAFFLRLVAEVGILADGSMYANIGGTLTDATGGGLTNSIAGSLASAAVVRAGGTLQITGSYAAAGPTLFSRYNIIELNFP